MTVEQTTDGKTVCPDCGKTFIGIANHWTKSSDCDWPIPDEQSRSVMIGLYMAGGSAYVQNEGSYPNMDKETANEEAARWIVDQLGFWSYPIQEKDQNEEKVEEFLGDEYDFQTKYKIGVRVNPYLETIRDTDAFDIPMNSLSAGILFAFKGHPVSNSIIQIQSKNSGRIVSWLIGNGFRATEISVYEMAPRKAARRVALSSEESRRFFDLISDDPIPGCDKKWNFEFADLGTWQGPEPTRRIE